ncbi:hypothetical protein OH492_00900 [Vibrio chagasii]|nr:hypothetical protein [Vibrio chagasii]
MRAGQIGNPLGKWPELAPLTTALYVYKKAGKMVKAWLGCAARYRCLRHLRSYNNLTMSLAHTCLTKQNTETDRATEFLSQQPPAH